MFITTTGATTANAITVPPPPTTTAAADGTCRHCSGNEVSLVRVQVVILADVQTPAVSGGDGRGKCITTSSTGGAGSSSRLLPPSPPLLFLA